nr:DUF6461 domain-containing protein [Streptomyces sp. NBC_00998]
MPDGLQWVAEANFDHYCLIFAKGLTPEELVRRMGGDPGTITDPLLLDDALQLDDCGKIAMIGSENGWAFALEFASAEGIDREVVASVSRDTEMVTITKSFTGPSLFRLHNAGKTVAEFEVHQPDELAVQGSSPAMIIPAMKRAGLLAENGISADPDDCEVCVLALAEQEFGLSVPKITSASGLLAAVNLEPLTPRHK